MLMLHLPVVHRFRFGDGDDSIKAFVVTGSRWDNVGAVDYEFMSFPALNDSGAYSTSATVI